MEEQVNIKDLIRRVEFQLHLKSAYSEGVFQLAKIINHHINFKEWPLKYRRSFKLIKDNNPIDIINVK